jgi:hypothetical protein
LLVIIATLYICSRSTNLIKLFDLIATLYICSYLKLDISVCWLNIGVSLGLFCAVRRYILCSKIGDQVLVSKFTCGSLAWYYINLEVYGVLTSSVRHVQCRPALVTVTMVQCFSPYFGALCVLVS